MRIVFLNCYDPRDPRSGGAEKFTINIAKRLVRGGHKVEWVSARFKGGKRSEKLHGIKFIRFGNRLTVLLYSFVYYIRNRRKIDLVIDQFHAYPFLTPLYVPRNKTYVIIHEVADEIWNYMTRFPVNLLGRTLERILISIIYRKRRFLTVSKSTKDDLLRFNIPANNISIIPEGIDIVLKPEKVKPKKKFQLISLGGIRKMKRIEDQIRAIGILKGDFPSARLVITGRIRSRYYERLVDIIKFNKLERFVRFTGYISEEVKNDLISSSYLVLGTSVKEGWGLAISEAAGHAVPAVCYNINGFQDSVKHYKSGLLTIENTPESLALAIKRLLLDKKLYNKLQKGALSDAQDFNWDRSYKVFLEVMKRSKDSAKKWSTSSGKDQKPAIQLKTQTYVF